LGKLEAA